MTESHIDTIPLFDAPERGVWQGLTENEQAAAAAALHHALGPAGTDLIVAVAQHVRREPDPAPAVCPGCGHPIDGRPYARVIDINGARHPLWLCAPCWIQPLLGQAGAGEGP